jgi:hypothetical protein
MKTETRPYFPDIRHLNHPVWNRDKQTIRLWLCLIAFNAKGSNEHDSVTIYCAKRMLGMADQDFYEAVRNLMEFGLLRLESAFCLDPREELPDNGNVNPLIQAPTKQELSSDDQQMTGT